MTPSLRNSFYPSKVTLTLSKKSPYGWFVEEVSLAGMYSRRLPEQTTHRGPSSCDKSRMTAMTRH